MTSFLLRLARFGALITILASISRVSNGWLLDFHRPDWTPDTEILIAGDSHIAMGIDPRGMPNARNIAQTSEPMVATHLKVRFLGRFMPNLHTVVLGFSPHNLATYNDDKFAQEPWAPELFSRYYGLITPSEVPGLKYDRRAYFSEQIRDLWTPNGHLVGDGLAALLGKGRASHAYLGGFTPLPPRVPTSEELDATLERHYRLSTTPGTVSSFQRGHLLKVIDELTARGVRVLLVATPTRPQYRAAVPEPLRLEIAKLCTGFAQRSDVACLDLTGALDGDDMFGDWDHLSRLGAVPTSEAVLHAILRLEAGE